MMKKTQTIELDYPLQSKPRYGWDQQAVHPQLYTIINRRRAFYEHTLHTLLTHYSAHYLAIARYPETTHQPAWINGSLPGLDAVALYGLISLHQPQRYFEIGIGHSTRFARQAICDHQLATQITAIDPYPPPNIEAICDSLIQKPLEQLDLSLFNALESGDILFVDSSHRVFMNSDVTVIFLEILPQLKPGVIVEFHDIALPLDYPPQWADKYYSEQYLLAAYLLAEGKRFDIMLPNAFITLDNELSQIMMPLWRQLNGERQIDMRAKLSDNFSDKPQFGDIVDTHGSSFWIVMNEL